MMITTSQSESPNLVAKAKRLADQLNGQYIQRRDRSLQRLFSEQGKDQCLVVSEQSIKWHIKGKEKPFFFHPGLAAVRIKRLLRGDNDIMIQACRLKPGDSFLDCTLGLGADSLVASYATGEAGRVVGIESEPILALLVHEGLKSIREYPELDQAAQRIEVIAGDHGKILQTVPDKSFDVVYFDPMFRSGIKESSSLQALRGYANPNPLRTEVIEEAKRVAKRMVVLKERKQNKEFERLGFSVVRKESSDVVYGVLEI